jgi:hypothetical protein
MGSGAFCHDRPVLEVVDREEEAECAGILFALEKGDSRGRSKSTLLPCTEPERLRW